MSRWIVAARFVAVLTTVVAFAALAAPLRAEKPRLLVLTDVGADPDDQQSLVRLLLYANEFDIEGLLATSAGTTGKVRDQAIHPELIRELVDAYGEVRGRLTKHAAGFPVAGELRAKIKNGSLKRAREAFGEGHDTEASAWIAAVVDQPDPRPVCVAIWGGQTDLAQALWRVRQDRGEQGLRKFAARLRVYDVADQDGLGTWIHEQCPDMFYIQAEAPAGRDKREGVFRGMYLGGDESLVSRQWMQAHIRERHGPLGALYPPKTWTAPNPHSAVKEGDTPAWLYFLPHGLNDPRHPEWGGLGGRFERQGGVYRDAADQVGDVRDARATVWRWRAAVQADFQARLDWCVADAFAKANHAPAAVLNGDRSLDALQLHGKPGELIALSAAGSSDPDGNSLKFRWFWYPEAGSFRGNVALSSSEGPNASFVAPSVSDSETVHVILEATDNGEPPLMTYRRAVVTIDARAK